MGQKKDGREKNQVKGFHFWGRGGELTGFQRLGKMEGESPCQGFEVDVTYICIIPGKPPSLFEGAIHEGKEERKRKKKKKK